MSIAIGVAGCGRWGANVVRDLLDVGVTVFVADPDPSRRDWARAAGAREVVGTVTELTARTECAGYVVVTPASTHRTTCAALLERGVPVFVEKPPGRTLADVEALTALGADRLFVMHKWRYHPGVGALAALARDGALGAPITLFTTRTGPQSLPDNIDVTWHLAVHDVSIALHVLGSVPPVAEARGRRDGDGRLVGVEAELRADNGTVHHLTVAAEDPDYQREVRCVGSDASAVLTRPDAPALEVARRDGSAERVPLTGDLPLARELAAFLAHCEGGPAPTSSMTDALAIARCLAAIDACV